MIEDFENFESAISFPPTEVALECPRPKTGRPRKSDAALGRPIKFDADAQRRYCDLLRMGCPRGVAARLVGVSRSVVLKAAKRDPQIAAGIDAAERHCYSTALRRVTRAGKTNWRASAWLLQWHTSRRGRPAKIRTTPSEGPSSEPKGLLADFLGGEIEVLEVERSRRAEALVQEAMRRRDAEEDFDLLAFLESQKWHYAE